MDGKVVDAQKEGPGESGEANFRHRGHYANKATTNLCRFEMANMEPLEVMARLTCDADRQCVSLIFGQGKKKLGYIPTEVKPGHWILRGMWVNEELRSRGLASMFLALWLRLCQILEVTPLTDRIHKPILALVLQKFGFVAQASHLKVEVARVEDGEDGTEGYAKENPIEMLIWSKSQKLSSYFSLRAQRDQGIQLVHGPCPQNSRTAFVNTSFTIPNPGAMTPVVEEVLSEGQLIFYQTQRAVSLLEDLRCGGWPSWAPRPKTGVSVACGPNGASEDVSVDLEKKVSENDG
eukprot:symbB.v1.2.030712.t1/scaffold3492.1/size55497/2